MNTIKDEQSPPLQKYQIIYLTNIMLNLNMMQIQSIVYMEFEVVLIFYFSYKILLSFLLQMQVIIKSI